MAHTPTVTKLQAVNDLGPGGRSAHVTLDSHNGPGAIDIEVRVTVRFIEHPRQSLVEVKDAEGEMLNEFAFDSDEDARNFAELILLGRLTVAGIQQITRAV